MKNEKLQLNIFSQADFTDEALHEFLLRNEDFSIMEYANFLKDHELRSELGEKLMEFISSYDNGFFKPSKCDASEPIKELFNEFDLTNPSRWVSQPGGAFYFKKTIGSKIAGVIENNRFRPFWENGKLLKPKIPKPQYLGEIKLFFDGKAIVKKGTEYWVQFIKELCKVAKAKTGVLLTQDESPNNYQIKDHEIFISNCINDAFGVTTIKIE